MSNEPAESPTPPQPGTAEPVVSAVEPGAPATDDAGWRRWMPRRRATRADADPAPDAEATDPADADVAPAPADEPAEDPTGMIPAVAPDGARRRRWGRRTVEPAAAEPPGDDAAPADAVAPVTGATIEGGIGRLRRRRRKLLHERETAVYHLGGLAFELYRRDMLDVDVLRRRAGAVAELDASVHDIDGRLEELADARRDRRARTTTDARTPIGNCLTCRAPFQIEARYCWQCGSRLAPPDPDQGDQDTGVITRIPG